jgi:hypothetical protein
VVLGPNAVVPIGFGADENMLPYPTRTFAGYNLLLELFTFPEKFRFVDVKGFGTALRRLGATDRVELGFLITPFEARRATEGAGTGVVTGKLQDQRGSGGQPVRDGRRADPAHGAKLRACRDRRHAASCRR